MRVLRDFPGELIPVNPNAATIAGKRAFPSLSAIGHPTDLAVLALPAQAAESVLIDGARAGLRSAVIISGGFAEAGETGAAARARIRDVCRESGIRLLGPNTSGFVFPASGTTVCFVPGVEKLVPGGLSIVAQSGGVNLTLAFTAANAGLGIGLAVGLGNSVDVDAAEVVRFLAEDDATRVIILHLEGVVRGRALCDAVTVATTRKPVIALTVGRSEIGSFAQSHTGNLIGQYDLKLAALKQSGAVIVEDSQSAVDAASAFLCNRLPAKSSPGVAIITGQAGPALLILDLLKSAGVSVPQLQDETVQRIATLLPPLTFLRNPVDTGRPSPAFADVFKAIADDPAIDAILTYAIH